MELHEATLDDLMQEVGKRTNVHLFACVVPDDGGGLPIKTSWQGSRLEVIGLNTYLQKKVELKLIFEETLSGPPPEDDEDDEEDDR